MVMADDTDDNDHTDEEHAAMSMVARQTIGEAVKKCIEANICGAVLLDELILALVAGAIAREFTLSDIVGDLIEEYLDAAASLNFVKQIAGGAAVEKKTRAH
jgi:hypothetical protein